MSTDHYEQAIRDLKSSYGDSMNDGTALWRATCAQAQATLALVDAIRDLASKTPEAGDPRTPTIATGTDAPPASGPLPGQCADCGHNADVHDAEDGHCMVGLVGSRCDCVGFEVQS